VKSAFRTNSLRCYRCCCSNSTAHCDKSRDPADSTW